MKKEVKSCGHGSNLVYRSLQSFHISRLSLNNLTALAALVMCKTNKSLRSKAIARARHSFNILSWNINGIKDRDEGLKYKLEEIKSTIKNHDFICLQETKMAIKIAGFRPLNSNRKNSKSGGIFIRIKNELSKNVTEISTKTYPDIVAVRLNKHCFGLNKDIVLVNVYDSQVNSSYKKNKAVGDDETIDQIEEFLSGISFECSVMLLGDFNARIANLEDIIERSDLIDSISCENRVRVDIPVRRNTDTKINTKGRPFTDLVKAHDLIILNGRTLGDIFGSPTCFKYNGVSCVDYICVS